MGQTVSTDSGKGLDTIIEREEFQESYLQQMEKMYSEYKKGDEFEDLPSGLSAEKFAENCNKNARGVIEDTSVFGGIKSQNLEVLDQLIQNATDIFIDEHGEEKKPLKKRRVEQPSTQVQTASLREESLDRKMSARDIGPRF